MKRLTAIIAISIALSSGARAQDWKMKPHPRLIMDNKEFKHVKKEVQKGKNEALDILHEICMKQADEAISAADITYKKDESGKRILSQSRSALARIFSSSYAYRFTGDEKYLRQVERDLNSVCSFKDWNPTHYLDVGEMAAAVAIGYDWLYDKLKPSTRESALKTLNELAFKTSLNKKWAWFYESGNNWNQVCNGGLVCAALATFESNPETSEGIINKAVESNRLALKDGYKPDGNYTEGPGYWDYGTSFEVLMLTLLENALGTDFGLNKAEGFMKTPDYILYSCGTSGKYFNFYDNGEGSGPHNGMWYFAFKDKNPSLLFNELALLRNGSYEKHADRFTPLLIYYAANINFSDVHSPEKALFAGQGETPVVLVRTGWNGSPEDKYLGIKGGKASTNHGHMDSGSFVYDAYGIRWAKDLGAENYAHVEKMYGEMGKSFWDNGQDSWRWRLFKYNNKQHNTLTVNDKDHHVNGRAKIVKVYEDGDRLGAGMDMDEVFKGDLASAFRDVVIRDNTYLELTDKLKAPDDKSASVRWTMVSEAQAEITHDGIVLEKNGVRMLLSAEGKKVNYRIWPSDPKAYDSPVKNVDIPVKGVAVCGFEMTVEAGESATIVTTLKKI